MAVGVRRRSASVGRVVGRGRRHVEETRRLLRLPGRHRADGCRPAARVGLDGRHARGGPANDAFYRIHTAIVVRRRSSRRTGSCGSTAMVDREIVLTYADLLARAAHRGLGHPQLRLQPGRRRR